GTVVANTAYGFGGEFVPIISPPGGHGSDPKSELGSQHLAISVDFANNEGNTIFTEVEFRQVGLLYNPREFANNENIFDEETFNQLWELSIVVSSGVEFTINEQIRGQTSNATGIVGYSNDSITLLTSVEGSFNVSETI